MAVEVKIGFWGVIGLLILAPLIIGLAKATLTGMQVIQAQQGGITLTPCCGGR
jgi:hypothetical protein